jgi:hypothetical protein
MTAHVVIRRESYVAGTWERPEVGIFTQTHISRPPVPWGRIARGDTVWMKWSGGPIVATARVQGFREIANCTPEQLRRATLGYGLHALEEYWASLSPVFSAVVVYLEDERWLDKVFVPEARSRGESWIVLDRPELEAAWLSARPEEGFPARRPLAMVAEPAASYQTRRQGSRTVPLSMRFEVLRRDNFRCFYCGRRPPEVVLHADHVVPWRAGGPTTLENLHAACSDCNYGKGARRLGLLPNGSYESRVRGQGRRPNGVGLYR